MLLFVWRERLREFDGGDDLLSNGFRDMAFQPGGVVHQRLDDFFSAELQYFMAGKVRVVLQERVFCFINFYLALEQMRPCMNKRMYFGIDDKCPIFRVIFGNQY